MQLVGDAWRAQNAEGARQEWAFGVSPAPPLRAREHVELARLGSRPALIDAAKDHVGPVHLTGGDGNRAPPERCGRARRAHITPSPVGSGLASRSGVGAA